MAISIPGSASSSRLTQLLQSVQSPPSDATSEQFETESNETGTIDARGRGLLRSRHGSSSMLASFSSSLNQKTPVRSYYHRPFHAQSDVNDAPHHTFESVREDTAELASRAVSESRTSKLTHDPNATQPTQSSPIHKQTQIRDGRARELSPVLDEDTSASPDTNLPSRNPANASMLTRMMGNPTPYEWNSGADTALEDGTHDHFDSVLVNPGIISQPHERTPLLQNGSSSKSDHPQLNGRPKDLESLLARHGSHWKHIKSRFNHSSEKFWRPLRQLRSLAMSDRRKLWMLMVVQPATHIPAVILGLLMNVLDALSYGTILFPLGLSVFSDLGPDGISMFYISCIASQLVYSLGGSRFKGGIGSEMIEVVPFFHKMAYSILDAIGDDNPNAVRATTILAYSTSSIFTGLIFFVMGRCHLGALMGFFPRHILIGCIGGVGWFLIATGLEVSARLSGSIEYNLATLRKLFQLDTLPLWIIPLSLAVLLLLVKRWVKHSLTDAVFFLSIIVVFFVLEAAIPSLSLDDLRSKGWVFENPAADVPWYHFYSLYDFGAVNWAVLGATVPTMCALTFFAVLHVPINIPALALSTGEDNIDVDGELRAHGYSNALSGLCGSIQNYLVYTNTLLFMRSGGDSRLAGVLLAVATFGMLYIGPIIIGYIPIMVVGSLIFFLGFELIREALVDTLGRVHRVEYLTIVVIVITMGAYDFVAGILVGIILACVGYVIRTSRISAIRGILEGGDAASTVRRHPVQATFLEKVGRQIYLMRLAGYLFFGTIVGVENRIKTLLGNELPSTPPIQFLVLDVSSVDGVDFSAAEAFTRINRILSTQGIRMIICGFTSTSEIGKSLHNVGLLDGSDNVEYFEGLNSALEFCENELLKALYQRSDALDERRADSKFLDIPNPDCPPPPDQSMFSSPRRGQLHFVAAKTLWEHQRRTPQVEWRKRSQPLQLILQTFASVSDKGEDFWKEIVPFFKRKAWAGGSILYASGDEADGFYILESGILKARYMLPQGTFSEVIVAGATCGELPFFSETSRTATTSAERDSVAWVLDSNDWKELQERKPAIAQELLKISLKLTSERMNTITKYMLLTGI